MSKTNALRQLDRAGIKYEVLEYDIPYEEFSGTRVAETLGMDMGACYKTLALRNGHDIYICVIPVNREIDLKKCAQEIGVRKNKGIYFDSEVTNHETIEVSAEAYGMSVKLNRDELLGFLKAQVKDISGE